MEKATLHINDEAASAGFFTSEHFGKFPRLQILTIGELLDGRAVQMPHTNVTFKQAEKIEDKKNQGMLGYE